MTVAAIVEYAKESASVGADWVDELYRIVGRATADKRLRILTSFEIEQWVLRTMRTVD